MTGPDRPLQGWHVGSSRTLWDWAQHWGNQRPHEVALVGMPHPDSPEGMESLTWQDLAQLVDELRDALVGAGVVERRAAVLCVPNSLLAVTVWLAVQAAGAAIHVMDPTTGPVPMRRFLDLLGPALVVVAPDTAAVAEQAARGGDHRTRTVTVDGGGVAAVRALVRRLRSELQGPLPVEDESLAGVATLMPTSGTSGLPKLVELTHENVLVGAERMARNSGFAASDRHYLCGPFSHTNAQLYLCAPPVVTGGSIAVVPRFSAGRWFDAARWTGSTVASMVAPPMRMALQRAVDTGRPVDAGALRLVQYGMSMGAADWARWDQLVPHIEMRQIYGQTESVSGVLGGSPWERDDRRTVGRPFLGVDGVLLVDESGAPVPDGTSGELWIKGQPGVTIMAGYRGNPEATAETIIDGQWLATGDIMVREGDGRFEFRGRRMHIIRRGGENLSTYALEADLLSCPFVEDVAVKADEDPVLDAVVVAHVMPAAAFDEASFLAWCREELGARGVPDHVRVHESFPRTPSGRVVLREL